MLQILQINKTLPPQERERNEESCEESGVVDAPPVLEPVPVHDHLVAVPNEVRNIAIAVTVLSVIYKVLSISPPLEPYIGADHKWSATLGVVSYSASHSVE